LYTLNRTGPGSQSYAQVPFNGIKISCAFTFLHAMRRASRPTFLDVDYDDPQRFSTYTTSLFWNWAARVNGIGAAKPVAVPSWFVDRPNGDIWLYYTGWNRTGTRTAFRWDWRSISMAVIFTKCLPARSWTAAFQNPIWAGTAFGIDLTTTGAWRMWYISGHSTVHSRLSQAILSRTISYFQRWYHWDISDDQYLTLTIFCVR